LKKWFLEWFEKEKPDVLCLQEVKAFEHQMPAEIRFVLQGYDVVWHKWERPGYAWTAIFYKKWLDVVEKTSSFEEVEHFTADGRVTEIKFKAWGEKFCLLNLYFPNGGTRANGQEMLSYKKEFYDKFLDYIKKLEKKWLQVITCGDFNVCHKEIDIARPKENVKSIWFLPEERVKLDEIVEAGFVDVFRSFYPDQKNQYSWWSYRAWVRGRNVWRRLDYFVTSTTLIPKVRDIKYQTEVMGSDHCPIMISLDIS